MNTFERSAGAALPLPQRVLKARQDCGTPRAGRHVERWGAPERGRSESVAELPPRRSLFPVGCTYCGLINDHMCTGMVNVPVPCLDRSPIAVGIPTLPPPGIGAHLSYTPLCPPTQLLVRLAWICPECWEVPFPTRSDDYIKLLPACLSDPRQSDECRIGVSCLFHSAD